MKEAKHTPGPWSYYVNPITKTAKVGLNPLDGCHPLPRSLSVQDACLIASAPELLVTLKRTLELAIGHACEAQMISRAECEKWSWVERARAVIAKAEGGQK